MRSEPLTDMAEQVIKRAGARMSLFSLWRHAQLMNSSLVEQKER